MFLRFGRCIVGKISSISFFSTITTNVSTFKAVSKPKLQPLPVQPSLQNLPDLPSDGHNWDERPKDCKLVFKGSIDWANAFFQRLQERYGLKSPKETVSKMNGKAKGSLIHMVSLQMAECDFLRTAINGLGKGKSLKEARKAAKLDLAERLFRVLPASVRRFCFVGAPEVLPFDQVQIGYQPSPALRMEMSNLLKDSLAQDCFVPLEGKLALREFSNPKTLSLPRLAPENLKILMERIPQCFRPSSRTTQELPVCRLYRQIVETVESNQITILSAGTGSGKSTQIPQIILEAWKHFGKEASCGLIVTQPRRIAAKSLAGRVAWEMGQPLGQSVGYSVRFEGVAPLASSSSGSVLFCTSGVLLRRMQKYPKLSGTSHLILDEIHERDVNTDVLLMLLRERILPARPDLRVILMSATLEAHQFTQYFSSAGFSVGTVLDVKGTLNFPVTRTFLAEISRGLPCTPETKAWLEVEAKNAHSQDLFIDEAALEHIPYDLILGLIKRICSGSDSGAILVFLPGWDEICKMEEMLKSSTIHQRINLHLLHSSSPASAADGIFLDSRQSDLRHFRRKVVLATNIAESSITIPDIVHVIDSGRQKILVWDGVKRLDRLAPAWISEANQRQRLGRAGRCQPGHYYGLYSEGRSLVAQVPPEIVRKGLDEVVLQVRATLGDSDPTPLGSFLQAALNPPRLEDVQESMQRLIRIGAINVRETDGQEQLSPLGRLLSHLPVHPAMGRMLCAGLIFQCLGPILTVAAASGERIFRAVRETEERQLLGRFISQFTRTPNNNIHSDHLLVHQIWTEWKLNPLGPKIQPFASVISFLALKRIDETRAQLVKLLREKVSRDIIRFVNQQQSWWDSGESDDHVVATPSDQQLYLNPQHNMAAGDDEVLRLVLTCGFYPDFAIMPKRNHLVLPGIDAVKLPSSSLNNISARPSSSSPVVSDYRRGAFPAFYLYQDVVDLGGQVMVGKTTAVDPILAILFAHKIQSKSPRSVLLDGWLSVAAAEESDLELLRGFAALFNRFLQYRVSQLTSRRHEDSVIAMKDPFEVRFLHLLGRFLRETDIKRALGDNLSAYGVIEV